MDAHSRAEWVTRNTQEVLVPDEVPDLFDQHEHPRAYIGFEPSGQLTVAHLVCIRKMRDLLEAGCDLTVFLADWHAWINDKLGGSLERIQASGRYMEAAFRSLSVDGDRVHYRWAHDLSNSSEYWARVIRVAKATSLARTRRAMSILGRREDEAQQDTAKLFYPAMQAADIFELPVEIAYAGMDQRRAHVLAREVAQQYDWPVPVGVHTPLISSLKGGGRMDPAPSSAESKMSKSDPKSAIVIPSDPGTVEDRITGAVCPPRELERNPIVEMVRFILFPWEGRLHVDRPSKFGGSVEFTTEAEFLSAWTSGSIHPMDLKKAVAPALNRLLTPANRFLDEHPEILSAFLGNREM